MALLFTAAEFRVHEGYTDDPPTDAQLDELIAEWQGWIERVTGQFFDERELEFGIDGPGSELIPLPVPIISIEFIKIGDPVQTTIQPDEYAVYKGRSVPADDRMNPRIKLKFQRNDIFAGTGRSHRNVTPVHVKPIFEKGELNVTIKGKFGFLEPGDSTPALILKALRRLVLRDAVKIADGGSPSGGSGSSGGMAGTVIEEWTDGHKYKLAEFTSPPSTWDSSGDAEVDRIMKLYRRATKIGAARDW